MTIQPIRSDGPQQDVTECHSVESSESVARSGLRTVRRFIAGAAVALTAGMGLLPTTATVAEAAVAGPFQVTTTVTCNQHRDYYSIEPFIYSPTAPVGSTVAVAWTIEYRNVGSSTLLTAGTSAWSYYTLPSWRSIAPYFPAIRLNGLSVKVYQWVSYSTPYGWTTPVREQAAYREFNVWGTSYASGFCNT